MWPLPKISDILASLEKTRYYSSLDLLSAFNQLQVGDQLTREVLAFRTPNGHYEVNRASMGCKIVPAIFQKLVQHVLRDVGKDVYVYLDDVLVATETVEDHLVSVEKVLKAFTSVGLKLKMSKCEFFAPEVKFLGQKLSKEGLSPLPDKIVAIKNFPTPSDVDAVRSFLGMVGYYKSFIASFSDIAVPLNKLKKKSYFSMGRI